MRGMFQSFAAGAIFLATLNIGARIVAQGESVDGASSAVAAPTAPGQPPSGPGSSDYRHAAFQVSRHGAGDGRFWLFTPDQPRPTSAPLVVFLHGWGGTEPSVYGAWIKHLVRRGNIVLFPRYQASLRALPKEMTGHAVTAIRSGVELLQAGGPVRPDLKRVAFVGHSLGAVMSANIAQRADRYAVPRPAVLFLAEPTFAPALGNYDQIAPDTLIAVVVGDDVKRDASALRILQGAALVPAANKLYVAIPSDHHGNPPLVSDHFAPCAAGRLGRRGQRRVAASYARRARLLRLLATSRRHARRRLHRPKPSPGAGRLAGTPVHGRLERRHSGARSDSPLVQLGWGGSRRGQPVCVLDRRHWKTAECWALRMDDIGIVAVNGEPFAELAGGRGAEARHDSLRHHEGGPDVVHTPLRAGVRAVQRTRQLCGARPDETPNSLNRRTQTSCSI